MRGNKQISQLRRRCCNNIPDTEILNSLECYRRFDIFVILISSLILKARIILELKSLVVLKQFWHFSRSQEYILLPFR